MRTSSLAPTLAAQFWTTPLDPSTLDEVEFIDISETAGQAGWTSTWSFGDGSTAPRRQRSPSLRK